MGRKAGGGDPIITEERLREYLGARTPPAAGTTAISEEFDVSRPATLERLNTMQDRGVVEKLKFGQSFGWWLPTDETPSVATEGGGGRPAEPTEAEPAESDIEPTDEGDEVEMPNQTSSKLAGPYKWVAGWTSDLRDAVYEMEKYSFLFAVSTYVMSLDVLGGGSLGVLGDVLPRLFGGLTAGLALAWFSLLLLQIIVFSFWFGEVMIWEVILGSSEGVIDQHNETVRDGS